MERQHKELVVSSNAKEEIFEEDIYIETFGVLRYSLSNDIFKIKDAIYKRTGNCYFSFIDDFGWSLNPELSNNVKRVMNKYNVNYSMTHFTEYGIECLVINKKEGNRWYITGYEKDINY